MEKTEEQMSVVISALFIDFRADVAKRKNRSLCISDQCTVYQFFLTCPNRSLCISDQCTVYQFWLTWQNRRTEVCVVINALFISFD